MAPSVESALIRGDLTCPVCEYSLRGLPGDVVDCPECGARCDLASLLARQRLGRWYNAPGFVVLQLPVMWLTLSFWTGALLWGLTSFGRGSPRAFASAIALVIVVGWLAFLVYTRSRFGDWRGPVLSLLAHVLLAGYFTGVIGLFISIFGAGIFGAVFPTPFNVVMLVLCVVACAALMYACRRGERYIAEQCIRRHLQRECVKGQEP